MPRKTAAGTPATPQEEKWVFEQAPAETLNVLDWVKKNQAKLEAAISQHPNFVEACQSANVHPNKKFSELLQQLVQPSNEEWETFQQNFRQIVKSQALRLSIPAEEREKAIENALFGSFARMVRNPRLPGL